MVRAQVERVQRLSQRPFEDIGPTGQHVVGLKGEILWQTRTSSLERSMCVNMD